MSFNHFMFSSCSRIILICLGLQCNVFFQKDKMKEKKPLHCKVWLTLLLYSTINEIEQTKWYLSFVIFFISLCHHITYPLPVPHNQAEVFIRTPFPPPWWHEWSHISFPWRIPRICSTTCISVSDFIKILGICISKSTNFENFCFLVDEPT